MKKCGPAVSIGLPTYNRPDYLRVALDSFRAQTFSNFEVIISDNASPDPEVRRIAEMVSAEDHRFRYVRQSSNIGPVENFWAVFDQATAPYFFWASDDDVWPPTFIERGIDALEGGGVSAWFCQVANIDENGSVIRTLPSFSRYSSTKNKLFDLAKFIFEPEIMGKANLIYSMFRRDALLPVVEKFRSEPATWGIDIAWVYSFLCRENILIDDRLVFLKRVSPGTEVDAESLRRASVSREDLSTYLKGYEIAARGSDYSSHTIFLLKLRFVYDYVSNQRWRGDGVVMWQRTLGIARSVRATVRKFAHAWQRREAEFSYAQCGEDLIIDFISQAMRIDQFTYADIGAHHPTKFSNTYRFYLRGCRGVLVEPDPILMSKIKRARPEDVCIQVGVGTKTSSSERFFVMSPPTLNTFSEDEAKRYEAMGANRIESIIDVEMIPINVIFEQNFPNGPPTVISLDAEGLDFEILSHLDLQRWRAPIICVETLSYSENRDGVKDPRITSLMVGHGYFVYADTYVNTIFVDLERWRRSGPTDEPSHRSQ